MASNRYLMKSTGQVILFTEIFFYRGGTLVNNHMRYKQCYMLGPFLEVYLHISFPNLLITNPPIMIFPNPWISSQTISLCPWIRIDPWLWPSLLSDKHMENQLYHPNFCPLEGFFFLVVLQAHPSVGLDSYSRALVQSSIIRQRYLQTRTELLPPLARENSTWGHGGLMERCHCNRCSKCMGNVSHLVLKLISAYGTRVGLSSYVQFSPDHGVLLDTLNNSSWWSRKHLRHYWRRSSHGQTFNVWQSPLASQEQFLNSRVFISKYYKLALYIMLC